MPQPFPLPITVGTDICAIDRIYKILSSGQQKGPQFIRRILTPAEIAADRARLETPHARWQVLLKKREMLDMKKTELGVTSRELKDARWRMKMADKRRGVPAAKEQEPNNELEREKETETEQDLEKFGSGKEGLGKIVNVGIITSLMMELETEEGRVLMELKQTASFLAGRFAAKEAVIKAHQRRRLTYHRIYIRKRPSGNGLSQAPIAIVRSANGSWKDGQVVPVSISHDGDYATAVCVACEVGVPVALEGENENLDGGMEKVSEKVPEKVEEGHGVVRKFRPIVLD